MPFAGRSRCVHLVNEQLISLHAPLSSTPLRATLLSLLPYLSHSPSSPTSQPFFGIWVKKPLGFPNVSASKILRDVRGGQVAHYQANKRLPSAETNRRQSLISMNIKAFPNTAIHRSFSGAGRPDLHPGQEVCHASGAESTVSHPAKMIGKMIGWFLRSRTPRHR